MKSFKVKVVCDAFSAGKIFKISSAHAISDNNEPNVCHARLYAERSRLCDHFRILRRGDVSGINDVKASLKPFPQFRILYILFIQLFRTLRNKRNLVILLPQFFQEIVSHFFRDRNQPIRPSVIPHGPGRKELSKEPAPDIDDRIKILRPDVKDVHRAADF